MYRVVFEVELDADTMMDAARVIQNSFFLEEVQLYVQEEKSKDVFSIDFYEDEPELSKVTYKPLIQT